MKKIVILTSVVLILAVTGIFALPHYAKSRLESDLSKLGYDTPIIGSVNIGLQQTILRHITLKDDHRIKQITLKGSPLSLFIPSTPIDNITIEGLHIKEDISAILQQLKKHQSLKYNAPLPASEVKIENSVFIIASETQDYPLSVKGTFFQDKSQDIQITGNVSVKKDNIDLTADIDGALSEAGPSFLDVSISTLKITHNVASVHRATGWLNVTQNNKATALSAQIDAGSGSLFTLPAKNLSLILGQEGKKYALIVRAQAAGVEGVRLLSDASFGGSSSDLNLQTTLDIEDTMAFTRYLEGLKQKPQSMPSFNNIGETKITMTYLPERRFVDGPLPFDIVATAEKNDILNGTFLIYPNDMDIRGSAQTAPQHTQDIQTLLSIPDDKVSQDTIRLDGSLKSFF